jgi:2-polyprenyl-3-methyl-5-hydroxy-6-metoxy-1,4-benzoquinol methylase
MNVRHRHASPRLDVLDAACGIGTQALGLAALCHRVTASDLSAEAVERASREAGRRSLPIDFSVADMRQAYEHHRRRFDLVIACDNAVPHLLTDEDLLTAFGQFFACVRPGGGVLLTVRDYEKEDKAPWRTLPPGRTGPHQPHGLRRRRRKCLATPSRASSAEAAWGSSTRPPT